jgi:hypothetical protein
MRLSVRSYLGFMLVALLATSCATGGAYWIPPSSPPTEAALAMIPLPGEQPELPPTSAVFIAPETLPTATFPPPPTDSPTLAPLDLPTDTPVILAS